MNGRYIIVFGTLYQKPVHALTIGGECVIDPLHARSSPQNTVPSRIARTLSAFMQQYGYIDPWRFLNTSAKQYSFLSHVHRTYSRINYCLIDKILIYSIVSTQYSSIAAIWTETQEFQVLAPRSSFIIQLQLLQTGLWSHWLFSGD